MVKAKQPAGPPMTLGNMRALGVQRLVASCLNDACRHVALIDVSAYPADTEVPSFRGPDAYLRSKRAAALPTNVTKRHTFAFQSWDQAFARCAVIYAFNPTSS